MNIYTIISLLGVLMFTTPSLNQVQEMSCEELSKIEITDSNRETILKKHKTDIYKCAGITREDSIVLTTTELPIIANGVISKTPSKTIGDFIKELNLIKAMPEYDDAKEMAVFVFESIDKKIDVKEKQKVSRALILLTLDNAHVKMDPDQLINYIFSPACEGLTYLQGLTKFLEQQKEKK